MDSRTSALIIAQSAQIRDSLLVLLRATRQIEAVHHAEDGPSALAMESEIQPVLVLVDYDTTLADLATELSQLRATWPQARYLVLLDDEQDLRPVQSAGADALLVKGIRAAVILKTIEGLLSQDKPAPPGRRS